jgi:hypothetical protein
VTLPVEHGPGEVCAAPGLRACRRAVVAGAPSAPTSDAPAGTPLSDCLSDCGQTAESFRLWMISSMIP